MVPLGSQTWIRCRFGLNVRRLMPVRLLADAAQVLGLAALGLVIAERGLLSADFDTHDPSNHLLRRPRIASSRLRIGEPDRPAASAASRIYFLTFFFGHRIVRLAPLHVAAFLDQVAHLVGRDGQLALRADVQGGSDQKVVAPPHSLC